MGESESISLYDFLGFSAPIVNAATGKFNAAKPGSTGPLKWRLLSEAGLPATNLASASVSVQSLASCASNAQRGTPTGGSTRALVHLGNGYYQLDWKTDKKWTGCKLMRLSLAGEGPITHNALFRFS